MELAIKVVPNSKAFRIQNKNGEIIVNTKSKAEDNKANLEIIKNIGKILNRKIRLLKGLKNRRKVIFIENGKETDIQTLTKGNCR
ncbi:MAG: DUF167 domain-containing protein [Candidatus ainarchaeum sp.]|nr:DUF167 domain-containing protein [Candidatus ainarchaeum sp.]